MPFTVGDDYWIEIPGGRYTLGLLPDEARRLAIQSAEYKRHLGPAYSHSKSLSNYYELEEQTGNPDWVTEYLLAQFPAREVDIAPFAIARVPLLKDVFEQFMAETGEPPASWRPERANYPVRSVTFPIALKLADWAGARLPFEDEWERAARGVERRLFPWGDQFRPVGDWLETLGGGAPVDPQTDTPAGIRGLLSNCYEWCADHFSFPPGYEPGTWGESLTSDRCRVMRGEFSGKAIPSAAARAPGHEVSYRVVDATVRLVRRDTRDVPRLRPMPRQESATLDVRAFEIETVRPALATVTPSIHELHSVDLPSGTRGLAHDDASKLAFDGIFALHAEEMIHSFDADPDRADHVYRVGSFLIARSRETFRRVIPKHGVFVWNIHYRLTKDGQVRARPVVAYRMEFDGQVHVLPQRFRGDDVDTPIEEITPAMIMAHVLESFAFYDEHSDSDESPF